MGTTLLLERDKVSIRIGVVSELFWGLQFPASIDRRMPILPHKFHNAPSGWVVRASQQIRLSPNVAWRPVPSRGRWAVYAALDILSKCHKLSKSFDEVR